MTNQNIDPQRAEIDSLRRQLAEMTERKEAVNDTLRQTVEERNALRQRAAMLGENPRVRPTPEQFKWLFDNLDAGICNEQTVMDWLALVGLTQPPPAPRARLDADISQQEAFRRVVGGAVVPDKVFDGYSVFTELQNDPQACRRTSKENVEDVLNAILRFKGAAAGRKCAANMASDPPQDCDAPFCGCNPAWSDCMRMLEDSGILVDRNAAVIRKNAERYEFLRENIGRLFVWQSWPEMSVQPGRHRVVRIGIHAHLPSTDPETTDQAVDIFLMSRRGKLDTERLQRVMDSAKASEPPPALRRWEVVPGDFEAGFREHPQGEWVRYEDVTAQPPSSARFKPGDAVEWSNEYGEGSYHGRVLTVQVVPRYEIECEEIRTVVVHNESDLRPSPTKSEHVTNEHGDCVPSCLACKRMVRASTETGDSHG